MTLLYTYYKLGRCELVNFVTNFMFYVANLSLLFHLTVTELCLSWKISALLNEDKEQKLKLFYRT